MHGELWVRWGEAAGPRASIALPWAWAGHVAHVNTSRPSTQPQPLAHHGLSSQAW